MLRLERSSLISVMKISFHMGFMGFASSAEDGSSGGGGEEFEIVIELTPRRLLVIAVAAVIVGVALYLALPYLFPSPELSVEEANASVGGVVVLNETSINASGAGGGAGAGDGAGGAALAAGGFEFAAGGCRLGHQPADAADGVAAPLFHLPAILSGGQSLRAGAVAARVGAAGGGDIAGGAETRATGALRIGVGEGLAGAVGWG